MKKLQFDYYHHPNFDYSDFMKSKYFNTLGFHKLKDELGTYIVLGGMSTPFISAQDSTLLESTFFSVPEQPPVKEERIGISENTLLAALAIAQKPELAPQLLALRQTT